MKSHAMGVYEKGFLGLTKTATLDKTLQHDDIVCY